MVIRQNPLALRLVRNGLLIVAAASLASCGVDYSPAGFPPDQRTRTQLPPLELPETTVETPPALPEPVAAPAPPPIAQTPSAGKLLLASARDQLQRGDTSRAAATLERALRITPNDPHLWHELARVRLAAGEWQQAIELANKSRVLAGDDQQLRSKNSDIIAAASKRL